MVWQFKTPSVNFVSCVYVCVQCTYDHKAIYRHSHWSVTGACHDLLQWCAHINILGIKDVYGWLRILLRETLGYAYLSLKFIVPYLLLQRLGEKMVNAPLIYILIKYHFVHPRGIAQATLNAPLLSWPLVFVSNYSSVYHCLYLM